jgi:hypothetical protein
MAWATDYGYDQAQEMRPISFQFGEENDNHHFDFSLEPTHSEWCHPADDGEYGNSAHAPSASSEPITWSLPHEGNPTLFAPSDPFASSSSFGSSFPWDSSMPLFGFGRLESSHSSRSAGLPSENGHSDEMGVQAEQSTTATERNTEASWGERTVFGPDIVPGSVRPFFPPTRLSVDG